MQKGFSAILALVITAAVVVGALVYLGKLPVPTKTTSEPSPAPTTESKKESTGSAETTNSDLIGANWKTYTNTTYKYSISFPGNLTTQVQAAGAGMKEALEYALHLYIYNPSDENGYLKRYVDINYFGLAPSVGKDLQKSNVKVGGRDAIKYSNSNSGDFDIYHISLPNTQAVLEVLVSKESSRAETANKILSTFKFN